MDDIAGSYVGIAGGDALVQSQPASLGRVRRLAGAVGGDLRCSKMTGRTGGIGEATAVQVVLEHSICSGAGNGVARHKAGSQRTGDCHFVVADCKGTGEGDVATVPDRVTVCDAPACDNVRVSAGNRLG